METSRWRFLSMSGAIGSGVALSALGLDLTVLKAHAAELRKMERIRTAKQSNSICCYCSIGLNLSCSSDKLTGKIFNIEGDPDHLINEGSLCAKGAGLLAAGGVVAGAFLLSLPMVPSPPTRTPPVMEANHYEKRKDQGHRPLRAGGDWCLVLSCLFRCLAGMGMMYHSLNFIGTILGGTANLKAIHNYSGIFFGASLVLAVAMWWKEAGLFSFPEDARWLAAAGGYLWHVDDMPEVGKYNPGQKMFFLAAALYGIAMVVSGLLMWFPLSYPVELVRWMFALHALGYVVIFAFFFIHLYLVTIGVPGSAPAMFSGWVTRGWVKVQHPKWLKEMEKNGTLVVYGEGRDPGRRR